MFDGTDVCMHACMPNMTKHMNECMHEYHEMKLQKYLGPSIKGLLKGTLEEETHSMGMAYDFLHMSSVLDVCMHACVCTK